MAGVKRLVNLDALIPREDFETTDSPGVPAMPNPTLSVVELDRLKVTYSLLRKPDFQRETSDWTVEKVIDLIRSFLDGDLIPALILWRSPTNGNFFVIDGAHRLSALIAWVQDDYGDGTRSREFFANVMPNEQIKAAEACRDAVKKEIGTYAELTTILHVPGNSVPNRLQRAKNLATFFVQLQWVQGDAKKAEDSFFKINQKATPIDEVELLMLQSRRKPNAIAARALIRAGVGHKYWKKFPEAAQQEIEKRAREVYDILFNPEVVDPIKTLDLPLAGRSYSAESVRLVFEFVNTANDLTTKAAFKALGDDLDGASTAAHLQKVSAIARRMAGSHPASLGLHPAVYFWSATGRYQLSAFLAVIGLIQHLLETDGFFSFTSVRGRFEAFMVARNYFINQLVAEYGAGRKSAGRILMLYKEVLSGLKSSKTESEIVAGLQAQPDFSKLEETSDADRKQRKNFSRDTKAAVYLREAIGGAPLCKICGARLHVKSITSDHIERKEDGGTGAATNAQLAHPYCNTGYKESQHATEISGRTSVTIPRPSALLGEGSTPRRSADDGTE